MMLELDSEQAHVEAARYLRLMDTAPDASEAQREDVLAAMLQRISADAVVRTYDHLIEVARREAEGKAPSGIFQRLSRWLCGA